MKLIELIFTCDGKEYLTSQQLVREIKDEVYLAGGRARCVISQAGFSSVFQIRILLIRIRGGGIQHFRLNTDPDPIRIQGFADQKLKKFTADKKLTTFWIKNCNLPISRPLLRTSKQQKKPSALKREQTALQNMTFLNFFLFL
jgi:hypothetical protein